MHNGLTAGGARDLRAAAGRCRRLVRRGARHRLREGRTCSLAGCPALPPPSATASRSAPPAPRSSTARPRMARTSTIPSRAARCMPAPSSCRRCLPPREQEKLSGPAALLGIAVGVETICRLSLVVPKAVHKAGFHPTAVFGAMAAAAGVGAALQLDQKQLTDALGIAGSMASGIIEYLADGSWTKRMHPGWAAQSGLRAALLGPRRLHRARAPCSRARTACSTASPTRARATGARCSTASASAGSTETLAFKPYPCGTMVQPYIDCARRLAQRGIAAEDIAEIDVRGRRGHRAPAVGAAGRKAAPAQRLCRQVLHALLHRRRIPARQPRPRRLHRRRGGRPGSARARCQGALPDRSRQSLPQRLHRPHPRHARRRPHARGAPAASARRRAGAALAGGVGGEVRPQRARRRLAAGADRRSVRTGAGAVG